MQCGVYKILKQKNQAKINKIILICQEKYSKFFGIQIRKPNIFLLESRKQVNDIFKYKTKDWVVGSTTGGEDIFILAPEVFTKESSHTSREHFYTVLRHEYAHVAAHWFYGGHKPRWLSEGLACYLAEQEKQLPTKNTALNIFNFFEKGGDDLYNVGFFWVKLLLKKFGKIKLLKLLSKMNSLTTKSEFVKFFEEIYGFKYNKKEFSELYDGYVRL